MVNNVGNQHQHLNSDAKICIRTDQDDRIFFTSDFDLSCMTTTRSLWDAARRNSSKRNKRSFVAWIVKLNKDNCLIVEGSLECGRRARTKPIVERLSNTRILSKFKHTYHLIGNVADPHCELPEFVRHRFQTGFPEDWEIVVRIWKSFASQGPNGGIRSCTELGDFVVEKKLKLAIDCCTGSYCFIECARKVDGVDNEMDPEDEDVSENIRNIGYFDNNDHSQAKINLSIDKSHMDHKSQDDPGSKTINQVRQLMGWTPIVVPDETVKYSLVFRGTLLSSMGYAVSKDHMTNAVHRRLSARIIETVNQELYELRGDINNTKYDVPKELVAWCRYGCPKQIRSFCERWSILRSDEMKFQKPTDQGGTTISQGRRKSPVICHDESTNSIECERTDPSSKMQTAREKHKRKRSSTKLNDDYDRSNISVGNDTTCYKKSGALLRNSSRGKSWPKIRRKSQTTPKKEHREDTDIAKDEDLRMLGLCHPSVTHEDEQQPSLLEQVPSLSYIYHRCAPLTESILSDGV